MKNEMYELFLECSKKRSDRYKANKGYYYSNSSKYESLLIDMKTFLESENIPLEIILHDSCKIIEFSFCFNELPEIILVQKTIDIDVKMFKKILVKKYFFGLFKKETKLKATEEQESIFLNKFNFIGNDYRYSLIPTYEYKIKFGKFEETLTTEEGETLLKTYVDTESEKLSKKLLKNLSDIKNK